jgi:HEAT repeat protein
MRRRLSRRQARTRTPLENISDALAYGGEWRRFFAVHALGRMQEPGVDALLLAALDHADESVRRDAARELIRRDPLRALEPILERLRSGKPGPREPTAAEIVGFGLSRVKSVDVVRTLIEALETDDSEFRRQVVRELGETDDERALDPLIEALQDPDVEVRRAATFALGRFGDDAVEPLIGVLASSDDNRQIGSAVWSLGHFKLIGIAREAVIEAALHDPRRSVRSEARSALASMGKVVEPRLRELGAKGDFRSWIRARRALRRVHQSERYWAAVDAGGWRKRLVMVRSVVWIIVWLLGSAAKALARKLRP